MYSSEVTKGLNEKYIPKPEQSSPYSSKPYDSYIDQVGAVSP